MNNNLVFDIENVDLHYGEKHVLKSVNLKIYEKEVTAFIGPSGCGKSTLLRCLNRMNDLIPNCKVEGSIKLHKKCGFRVIGTRERIAKDKFGNWQSTTTMEWRNGNE